MLRLTWSVTHTHQIPLAPRSDFPDCFRAWNTGKLIAIPGRQCGAFRPLIHGRESSRSEMLHRLREGKMIEIIEQASGYVVRNDRTEARFDCQRNAMTAASIMAMTDTMLSGGEIDIVLRRACADTSGSTGAALLG